MTAPTKVVQHRPAETTGVAFALAVLIAKLLGLDDDVVAYIAIIIGFVPAAITWLVVTVKAH